MSEGLPKKELKKMDFKMRMDGILNREITVENLGDYASLALNDLVELTGDVVEDFRGKHPVEAKKLDGKALEDEAYKANNLPDVGEFLDVAQTKTDQIKVVDSYIRENVEHIDEVITPPDQNGRTILNGGIEPYEAPKIRPRFRALLYILANNGINLNELKSKEGIITENMVRGMSYISVEIQELNRLVLVCDEDGNASYIFDLEKLKERSISIADVRRMTKEEKNELIAGNPGIGVRLIYSENWMKIVESKLLYDLEENGESELGLPKASSAELDPWKYFWTDSEKRHWGSVTALGRKLGIDFAVLEKRIKRAGLEPKSILNTINRQSVAYCYEDVIGIKDIAQIEEILSVNREGEWKGFYIDREGKHWGSRKYVASKLEVERGVVDRVVERNSNLLVKKIGSQFASVDAYCYEDVIQDEYLAKLVAAPRAQIEGEWKGFYIDKEGKHWGSTEALIHMVSRAGFGRDIFENYISHKFRIIEIKPVTGALCIAYCLEDVLEDVYIKRVLNAPVAEKRGEWKGFFIDQNGRHWGAEATLAQRVGVGRKKIRNILDEYNLDGRDGIDEKDHFVMFFCYEEITATEEIKKVSAALKVEKHGEWEGFYIDESGKHWGSIKALTNKFRKGNKTIDQAVEKFSLKSKSIQALNGSVVDGYCFEDMEKLLIGE